MARSASAGRHRQRRRVRQASVDAGRGRLARRRAPGSAGGSGSRRDPGRVGDLAGAARPARAARSRARPTAGPGCRGAAASASTSSVGPASTTRPRYITAIRSAMFQARPRSWVTTSTESPSSSRSWSSSARISPRIEASSDETGSSATSTCGLERQRAGDQHALALAAGQLVRVAQEAALRRAAARPGDSAAATSSVSLVAGRDQPCMPQPLGDRLVDGLPRVQRAGRVLQHQLHPAAVAPCRPRARVAQRLAVEQHLAGRRAARGRAASGPAWSCREPDSPTSATTSPRPTSRSTPSTARATCRRGSRNSTADGRRPPRARGPRLAHGASAPTCTQAALAAGRRPARSRTSRGAALVDAPAGSAGGRSSPAAGRRVGRVAGQPARGEPRGRVADPRERRGQRPVYGCRAGRRPRADGPSSTTRPAYITASRSQSRRAPTGRG